MLTDHHIWRTADGDLVPDGHPDAAFLAYAAGDNVPGDIARTLGFKAADRTADKAAPKTENKGSGLQVDTVDALRRQAEDLGIAIDNRWGAPGLRKAIDAHLAGQATETNDADDGGEEDEDGEEE